MSETDEPVHDDAWIRAAAANVGALIRSYQAGTVLWHRASGDRLVVEGWIIVGNGTVQIRCTDGKNSLTYYHFEIARTEPDEQWKQADT